MTVVGYHNDPALCRIAFFSNQDIKAGTELTFAYFTHEVDVSMIQEDTLECNCGAENCRKYLI